MFTSSDARYRVFDPTATALDGNTRLIHSRHSDEKALLSEAVAGLLFRCREFDTLEGHARRHARRQRTQFLEEPPSSLWMRLFAGLLRLARRGGVELPLQEQEIGPIQAQLRTFVKNGLLVSEEAIRNEVIERCRGAAEGKAPPQVTAVGIPTRNRPACLRRALESYTENFKRYGRTPRLLVADNSEEEEVQQKNRRILRDVGSRYEGEVRYLGLREREKMAQQIVISSGVPGKIAQFALLGDERCSGFYGAARNALLLSTVGETMLQLDDDTICNIAHPLEKAKSELRLSSRDVNEVWWYKSRDEVLDVVSYEPLDLLGLHERLLGKDVASHILKNARNGSVSIDQMEPSFLRSLNHSHPKVAVSMLGTVGDSGMYLNHNMARLLANGNSWDRLVTPDAGYRDRVNTRALIRAPRTQTLTDSVFCMSMCLGLDNSSPLPPYPPVQRDEDGVFRAVLRTCVPEAYSGYLPYLVQHNPPGERSHATPITEETFPTPVVRTNDIIKALIFRYGSSILGRDPKRNVQLLGEQLSSLGTIDRPQFEEAVRPVVSQRISSRISRAEQRLQERRGNPSYWAKDVRRFITTHRKWLTEERLCAPTDVAGKKEKRIGVLQDVIGKLGHLFTKWPEIVEVARNLSMSDQRESPS